MPQINERVYNNRDNAIGLELLNDGVEIATYDDITRVQVEIDDAIVADSNDDPSWFDWTGGKLLMRLGFAGITAGSYIANLIIYDATNVNGVFWEPHINLTVID